MGYVEQNLMNGETIIHRSRLHWIVFLWPLIFLLIALLLFNAGGEAIPAAQFALLLAVLSAISRFMRYTTTEIGITNKRVIGKSGFIRRNSLEVLLDKVEGIQVDQGVLGRILNFGNIIVVGTGGTKNPFPKIIAPLELRKAAQEQISGNAAPRQGL
ncbi:MAG: PH domain-containing protein [Balneolaceae bacterium]|nr:MAG: PH domain-containing protein [Balneolaceae bacterium]